MSDQLPIELHDAISPMVPLLHKLYDHITGIIGHSGVEHGGGICLPPSPMNSVTSIISSSAVPTRRTSPCAIA
ncbi:hypothetical protein HN018_13725 [Lichenicola cladoniae]|uniref:Uncharacterized protein n=1 Tax=Lichenicola cladoniae TaxID=1484109 RepID=A0A6M8HR51_9PROT|nr:hypothetical protein [Lichenicola cladoniae]QKE90959.1 hypothetical protein HN018_13725 [Lichenicola cladoniae]